MSSIGRIQKAYQAKFRSLLNAVHARKVDKGLEWYARHALEESRTQSLPLTNTLAARYQTTRQRIEPWHDRWLQRHRTKNTDFQFLCDSGLGGLARWLRACGYDATWEATIDDDELLNRAAREGRFLLTTDSMLMERRRIQRGEISALWLPPALGIAAQLEMVVDELGLGLRKSRCMNCGGELALADKATLRDQIPPKTFRWLDEYYVCTQCGKLFWHGTHWQKIQERLGKIRSSPEAQNLPGANK